VDASSFLAECDGMDDLAERGMGLSDEDDRSIVDLLVDQVEFADVIVLNKVDVTAAEDLERCEAIVRRLNPEARLLRTEHGRVALDEVLDTGRFDLERAAGSPGWLQVLRGEEQPETDEYGITSFVYCARRPFHPREGIVAELDACLLTDAELALGDRAWQGLPDPFPEWLPFGAEAHAH